MRVPWFRLMVPTDDGPTMMLEGPSRDEVYRGLTAHPSGWVDRCEQVTTQTPWIRDSP